MAGIDEIIKKQKEHLTKAQIRALAKAAERYKQYGSANRAEAYGSLHKGLSSTRRNLQNMGLASRQGKLISGTESTARTTAERTYSGYNQQLNKVSDAYTRQAAARMARENQIQQYLEDLKKQQEEINAQIEQYKKEEAKANAARRAREAYQRQLAEQQRKRQQEEQAARETDALQKVAKQGGKSKLWNTQLTDSGSETGLTVKYDPRKQPTAFEQAQAYALQHGANKRDAIEFAMQYDQQQKAYERAKLTLSTLQNWQQSMTGKEWDQDQDLQRLLYKQVQSAERTIQQNSAKWDAAINGEYSPRDSVGKGNKRKAIQEKEAALSKRNRAVAAMQNPQYAQYIMMPDDQFAVSYDAVKQQAERMRQQAWILRKDQAESMDDLSSEAARLEREAMELLAPWDQANALREGTGGIPSLASTVAVADADKIKDLPYDESKTPVLDYVQYNQNRWNPVKWASNTNFDGQNWRAAIENNWSAEDYDNTHDTKGSKFAALIFEWSYINGRTAFLYNQEFKSTYNVLNFGELFSKDVSRDDAYRTFRYRCMMAFYDDDYESTRSKEKLEQMDAMLTLANLMTDEERARFTGMLETYGAKYADEYFEYLYNKVLPNRFQQYLSDYMGWQTSNPMDRLVLSIGSIPTNLIQGATQPIQTLFTKQTDPVAARLSAAKANRAQSMRGAVGQHYGKWGRFFYDTGMSMADSATVAAISGGLGKLFVGMGIPASMAGKAGSVIGGSLLGGSAFNSAYQEALDRGLSPDMARVTAFGQGVNEMLFESLSLDLLIDQFKKGGILKVSEKALKNWIVNTLVQGGVEGSEEVFTDLANNLWDKQVNGIFSEELTKLREYLSQGMSYDEAKKAVSKEFAEQLGMSFLGGFASGGVMGGAAGAMYNIQMRDFERYGAKMDADAKAEVRGFNFKDKQMQELAKQSKLTNQDYGVLAVARDQQLQQNALDYNAKLLKEGKITAEVKKLFDRFIENPGLVENQDGGLTDFNGNEVFTAEEVAQMSGYDKYLQNAVDIRGNQDALIQQREEQAQALAEQQKRLDNPLITNEERAQRIGQEFGTPQIGARERIAGDMAFQRGASDAAASSPRVNKSVIEGMKLKDAVTVKGNKVDTKKGNVTFDYGSNKTTDTMTNDQLIALRYAQGMADITGSNIKVESEFVGKDKNADGFYNPDTDTVHINLKGKNSMVYTLAHELTHRIAKLNKAAYTDLLKAVKEELSRTDLTGDRLPEMYQDAIGQYMDGETSIMDALRKYEREHYRRNGIILDKDGGTKEVDEEIVCKCCETFLADPRFVQNMVTKHKTGAKAVYSFLKDVYNDMKALFGLAERNADEEAKGNAANISAESDILAQFGNIDRIFKLWSRAVKQMQKQTVKTDTNARNKTNEGIRYSFRGRNALYSKPGSLDLNDLRDKQGNANLKIAYKMDREGIDSEKIRLATGWFKGYDGKWRNEIDDSGAKLADWLVLGKGIRYMEEKADKALSDLRDKIFSLEDRLKKSNKVNGSDSEQSKALRKELRKTRKQKEEALDFDNRMSNNRLKLSDILDHAKLYENYPQLKDVSVHLTYRDRTGGYLGMATGTSDITLVTDLNSRAEILETLMHEVQHIIQGIEGFAKGANVEYWADRNVMESADLEAARATLAQVERDLSSVKYEGYPQASPLKTALMYAYITGLIGKETPGTASYAYDTEQKEKYEKRAEEGGYADLLQKYLIAYQDVKVAEMEAKDYTKAFADYRRTAGEVEARDVARRLRMSEDERKSTRPDIDRSDVRFIENDGIRYSVSTDVGTAIEDNGVVVDEQGEPVLNVHDHGDGGVQYSYSTWKKEGRDTLKAFMKKDTENYAKKRRKELRESGKSKAEVKAIVDSEVADMRTQYERIMKQMDKIYEISEKYLDKYASFGAWSRADVTVDKDGKPVFSVIRANGEYPMNIDFSLVCVKRRALDAVLNEIVRRGFMEKLVLDGESLVKVNDIIRQRGFEVACMGCFVEAKRFRQQGVAEGFAEKYNEIVKSLGGEAAYANFGQDETVKQSEGITGKKDSELNWSRVNELIEQYNKKKAANSRAGMTVEEAIAFELKENPKSRVLLKSGDFMSTRGMDRVAEVAPSILTLYNKQKGTGGPKAVFGDMQYLNDVCKKQWNVNKAYAVGGVRVQSFSDFVPRMFFDYCQMIADLATRKLPAHAYTKEESFVRLYGLTGMKINMSLFPKVGSDGLSAGLQYMRDKNGDIVYKDGKPVKTYAWAGESFNYDVAKKIQADAAYGKNCGTIAVGISDEQIRMMMADPTIRMIIPYHKSSLNPVIAEMMGIQGFTDYTEYQRTKLDGKAIDVDFAFNQRLHEVGDPQAVVKEYLDWCKENGYTAKFEQFAYNADGSINENYYKLLEDFTLYDEQGNYCPQEAVQTVYPENMDALLDKYLKQDSDMQEARDAMIPAVADEIIRAMDRKASMSNTDFKTDKLGNKEYLKYLQLGAKVVNQTATEAEIKEFKQRMVQLSEDNRMAFLDKLREKLIRADEAAKVREVRDRQIARLKEEFKESREKARERRIRSDLTNTLKKGNDRIVQLLSRPTENAHVPVQLAQAVSEYAMRLNDLLTKSEPKTGEFAGMEKQTQKGALNAQKILDALKRSYADEETIALLKAEDPSFDPRGLIPVQYDENGKMIKDDSLAEMVRGMDEIVQGKHLNELTTDELRYVMNTMRGVIYAVTEANKVTVDGESRNVYRTSRKMANEVKSASKVFGDKSNAITKFLNRYVIESLGLRRIAKLYSGSNENATFVKLVDDLNEGAIEQERIKQTLRNMFNDVTSKYEKDMKTWYGKNAEWIDTGFGFKITKGMRVSLAMHILNEQNLRNVEKAGLRIPEQSAYRKGNYKEAYKNGKVYRLTKAQAEQIVANMTEAEKAYFEVAKEFFHKRSGFYINRTSLKLLGYSKAIVENYFPIQTDDAYRTVKYDDVRQNASVEHPGFLESRKGTANVMYLNDITAVVNRQIDGVAKYAGLAIPMRNWNNIMNAWLFEENEDGEWVRSDDGRAHDVLERRMGYTGKGKAIIDYVDQFITDLTSPRVRDANENVQAAEFAAKITSNYVKAVLTLNARVALSQLASVPTAAAEIPWKYIVQSFGGNVEGHLNRNASNDLIDQYTPIFAMRRAGTQTEVSEVMKRKGFADKAEQKLPGLLGWITGMDVMATRRLWYACERWVKGETDIPVGSDAFYKEVARRYNRVIQNTQPNFTVLQRSPALRSKSAAARIITMFGTQRMQNAGVFIESLAEVVQTKDKAQRKAAMKKFGRTLSGLITAAIVIGLERALVSALRGRMRPLQDEDKDITVGSVSKYIMGEIGTSLAGSFMYVGELYDFVHGVVGGLADGDSGYETSFSLPAAEALSTVIEFFKNKDWQYFEYMRGDHTDHEKWLKTRSFVNELMTVASYATGLPLANASKTILNGAVPLVQDIVESTKTGELNLYLHQSGKLDSAKTAANYKEWTNLGKKGSVYLAWENRFKEDTSNGLDHRAELLFEDRELSADEKAILLRMSNSTKDNPLTSKDGVVYKDDGTVVVDFTNLDRYRASTMLSDKQYEGFLNLVDMGVAEDVASTAFIQYNVQKKQGSGANDRFRDWLFKTIKNPEDRAKVDMAVVGNTVRVEGTIGYKENGEVYADYSSKEMFDLYTSGKKQQKSDAIISTTDTPEAKAKAFADTDNDYHAKGGIVYNDKDKVVADFTSDEAYRASQMGESHYGKYTEAVKQGMTKENAILAVEKHKEFTNDDDKDNATQYATWVFNTYKSAKDRAIAGAIYSSKPVTIKDGRTYDENGYIYRDYTSAAWYKLSNRTLSKDGVNKRYEAAKLLEKDGYSAEKTVAAYVELDKLSKKTEWQKWLKDNGYTNDQIKIILWSRGWAKLK